MRGVNDWVCGRVWAVAQPVHHRYTPRTHPVHTPTARRTVNDYSWLTQRWRPGAGCGPGWCSDGRGPGSGPGRDVAASMRLGTLRAGFRPRGVGPRGRRPFVTIFGRLDAAVRVRVSAVWADGWCMDAVTREWRLNGGVMPEPRVCVQRGRTGLCGSRLQPGIDPNGRAGRVMSRERPGVSGNMSDGSGESCGCGGLGEVPGQARDGCFERVRWCVKAGVGSVGARGRSDASWLRDCRRRFGCLGVRRPGGDAKVSRARCGVVGSEGQRERPTRRWAWRHWGWSDVWCGAARGGAEG